MAAAAAAPMEVDAPALEQQEEEEQEVLLPLVRNVSLHDKRPACLALRRVQEEGEQEAAGAAGGDVGLQVCEQ